MVSASRRASTPKGSKKATSEACGSNQALARWFGAGVLANPKGPVTVDDVSDAKPVVQSPTVDSPMTKPVVEWSPDQFKAAVAQNSLAQEAVESSPAPEHPPNQTNPIAPPLGANGLSEEQMQRIQENRKRALERQQLKRAHEDAHAPLKPDCPMQNQHCDEGPKIEPKVEPKIEPKIDLAVATQAAPKVAPKAKSKTKGIFTPKQAKESSPEKEEVATPPRSQPAPRTVKISEAQPKATPEKLSAPFATPVSFHSIVAQRRGSVEETYMGKFEQSNGGSWMQFNDLYALRLEKLRGHVLSQAKSLWSGTVAPQGFLSDVSGYKKGDGHDVVIIGILFKDLKSRPNVIEHFRNSKLEGSLPGCEDDRPNICSDADELWLEDGSMRVQLDLPQERISQYATGLVVGARGLATSEGKFKVNSMCFAQIPPPPPLPASGDSSGPFGPYVAFVSGFMFGSTFANTETCARAVQFLTGGSADAREASMAKAVQRLIVCGGTVAPDLDSEKSITALQEADAVFRELATALPVDVIPGSSDPTNLNLPQAPLHPYLFRSVRSCRDFRSVSNPHECSIDGLRLLGHAGQPVEDLLRCTSIRTPLEALTTTLEALHLAPTAPDTLSTQPFKGVDPFVINTTPNVIFSGGHPRAAHGWSASRGGGTMCVCVPAFHAHPAVVLVNLRDPRDVRVHEFFGEHKQKSEDVSMGCNADDVDMTAES